MKHLLPIIFAVVALCGPGCEMKTTPQGLRVEFKPDSATKMKSELLPFLLANGFKSSGAIVYILADTPTSQPRVLAYFTDDGAHRGFVIGKITSSFTAEEVQLIDHCAELLILNSDSIVSGSLIN